MEKRLYRTTDQSCILDSDQIRFSDDGKAETAGMTPEDFSLLETMMNNISGDVYMLKGKNKRLEDLLSTCNNDGYTRIGNIVGVIHDIVGFRGESYDVTLEIRSRYDPKLTDRPFFLAAMLDSLIDSGCGNDDAKKLKDYLDGKAEPGTILLYIPTLWEIFVEKRLLPEEERESQKEIMLEKDDAIRFGHGSIKPDYVYFAGDNEEPEKTRIS